MSNQMIAFCFLRTLQRNIDFWNGVMFSQLKLVYVYETWILGLVFINQILQLPIKISVEGCDLGFVSFCWSRSVIGYFSPKGFDYRTMMDPEPGRCRRTDGKKWRCGKNVVPDQKYCERHMHRGRQRSRKPVEAFKIASPSESTPSNKLTDKLAELKTKHANSPAVGLQLMTPSCTNSANSHSTSTTTNTNTPSSNIGNKKNEICDAVTTRTPISATAIPATVTASITTTPATAPTLTANSNNKIDHNTDRKDMSGNYACYNATMKSSRKRVNNINIGMSTGLDFSPKSVLQGNISNIETLLSSENCYKWWHFCNRDFSFTFPSQRDCFLVIVCGINRWTSPLAPLILWRLLIFLCRLFYLFSMCLFCLFFRIYIYIYIFIYSISLS